MKQGTRFCVAISIVWFLPGTVQAQGRSATSSSDVWEGVSIGAALGRSGNEDEHHAREDRGRDVRGDLEIPLGSRFAARVEVGRVSWRYDLYGPLHEGLHPSRDDVVTVNRVTASLLAVTDPAKPVRGYIGGGIGLYHWGARVGTIDAPLQRGATFTTGLAVPVRKREWAVTGDLQVNVMNSPNQNGRPGPDGPVSGSAVFSLTFSIGVRKILLTASRYSQYQTTITPKACST